MSLSVLVFLSHQVGWLDTLELKSLDFRFQIRGPLPTELPILLVSIDQDSFDELNLPWPWPRDLHAELIQKLSRSGARVIALDILFTEPKPDPREDRALAKAIQNTGNVILAGELTEVDSAFGPRMSISLPLPSLREHALAYGPVNLTTDRDGTVRSGNLAFSFQDRIFPSFAYQIYRAISGTEKTGEEKISLAPYLINFRGPRRSYPVIPYYRILRDEIDASFFRDKIILVGAFAPSLHDLYRTPFSTTQPTAGVEIQANFIETLVANNPLLPLPSWVHAFALTFLVVLTVLASVWSRPLWAFLGILVFVSGYCLGAVYLFSFKNVWIPIVPPLLAAALSYGGVTLDNYVRERKERIRLRATFSKYVSPNVVEEIVEDRHGLGLGGKRRHITVLFSDIRGFTSVSEQIDPEMVVHLLSDYLAQVTHIVFKHKGTIDKFIGDAVFAIFGAPRSYGNDAFRAVQAGIEMIRLAESLSPKWVEKIGRPLKIGVGVNTGEAVVGAIGSEIRSDFTAIGDAVNLGSRLEDLTKELGVPMLLSEFTVADLKGAIPLRLLRRVRVGGRETPILVYCPEVLLEGRGRT